MISQNSYQDLFGSFINEGISQVDSLYVNKIYGLDSPKITIVDQMELNKTSNQIVFVNSSNKITVNANATTTNRIYNLTDVGSNCDFVLTAGAQTLDSKTLTNATIGSIVNLTVTGVANIEELHVDTDLIFTDIPTRSILIGGVNAYGPRLQIDLPPEPSLLNEIGGASLGIYPSGGTPARQELLIISNTNAELSFVNALMGGKFSLLRGLNNGTSDFRFWVNKDSQAFAPYGSAYLGDPQMILSNQGYFGVGTASPSNIVQVGGGGRLRIANNDSDYSIIGTANVDGASNTKIVLSGNTRGGGNSGCLDYVATGGGVHRFTGRVGIGTGSTVNNILQVGQAGRLKIANDNADFSLIGTTDVDAANNTKIVLSGPSRFTNTGFAEYFATTAGGQHIFYNNALETMRISPSGRVGINSTNPTGMLTIASSTNPVTLHMTANGADQLVIGVNQANAQLGIGQLAGEASLGYPIGKKLHINSGTGQSTFIMDSGGRVSIGTPILPTFSNPLTVWGNTSLYGSIIFNNSIISLSSFIESSSSTTIKNYTLPATAPATNGDVMTCTTAGQMSWKKTTNLGLNSRLFAMTSDGVIFTNSVTSTILSSGTVAGTKTIPGGFLEAGSTIQIKGAGLIKAVNNTTLVWVVRYGTGIGNELFTGTMLITPAIASDVTFTFDMTITMRTVGTSSSSYAWCRFGIESDTTDYTFDLSYLITSGGPDTTINKDIDIAANWGAANVGNSIQLRGCVVNIIY